jgi:hypothetical protein
VMAKECRIPVPVFGGRSSAGAERHLVNPAGILIRHPRAAAAPWLRRLSKRGHPFRDDPRPAFSRGAFLL